MKFCFSMPFNWIRARAYQHDGTPPKQGHSLVERQPGAGASRGPAAFPAAYQWYADARPATSYLTLNKLNMLTVVFSSSFTIGESAYHLPTTDHLS